VHMRRLNDAKVPVGPFITIGQNIEAASVGGLVYLDDIENA